MKFKVLFLVALGILFSLPTLAEEINLPISVTITVLSPEVPPPPGGGGGGGGAPTPTIVIFDGRAYPKAFLTLLKDGKVAATFSAEDSGKFRRTINGLRGGVYEFGIFAEDTEGRKSITLSFSVSVLAEHTTTISGIFISPTIELTPTQVERGANVDIFGQVFPESQIKIFVSSEEAVKEAKADKKGKWTYRLDTNPLAEGEHSSRAKALFGEGEQSPFSQTLNFLVLAPGALVCRGADFNFDGKVDLIDFSIMMYWWASRNPGNPCVDLNHDKVIDIIDFSILMYWWTG